MDRGLYARRYQLGPSGFTLIELLVVIAIIAILAVVVVLTLNPAQLLAQSRDANRVSDMATLASAFNLYTTDQSGASSFYLGNPSSTYISIFDPQSSSVCNSLGLPAWNASSGESWACATSATYRNTTSTGWVGVNFNLISSGAPFGNLPVDPVNQTSTGLFYAYNTNGSQFEVTANFESSKYKQNYGTNVQTSYFPEVISGGTPGVSALYNPTGLVGYWPLNEGAGAIAYDQSGSGHNGNWAGSASSTNGHYSTNTKVGSYSGYFDGTTNQVNISSGFNIASSSAISEMAWVDLSSAQTNSAPTIMWLSGTGYQAQLGLTGSSTVWSLRPCVNGNCPTDGSGNHVNANQWALVAFTYTGGASGTMAIYLNGVLDATTTAISPNTGTPTSLIINWTAFSTSGFFNDARVYSRALSPAEMMALYTAEH